MGRGEAPMGKPTMDKMQNAGEIQNAGNMHSADDVCAGLSGADFYSCEEAVKRLNEYLDHQLTASEATVVMRHLELCRPCLRRFTFEQTLVVSLRHKVNASSMPPALRDKLHLLLLTKE